MKKVFSILSIFCVMMSFGIFNVYAEKTSADIVNRRTAIRYLQLSKKYAAKGEWQKSFEEATNGSLYDSTVADLQYLIAVSLLKLDHPRKEVLEIIKNTFYNADFEWVDYNQTNARILYADLLCSTNKSFEAISILDKAPMIFSADAEYIRIKSYYQIGTEDALEKARSRIDSVRKIYPNDLRFPRLFFSYEYRNLFLFPSNGESVQREKTTSEVKKIADSFIIRVPEYDRIDEDIEMYAAIFAEGETKKRLLQSYTARGFKNILYPAEALLEGVLSEKEALDYFLEMMNGKTNLLDLEYFVSLLSDENVKKEFTEYLNAFSGLLCMDTTNSLEYNLISSYNRGRIESVSFDNNNEGEETFNCVCDFGVPLTINYSDENLIFHYGKYPAVTNVVYNKDGSNEISIGMIDEVFEWSLINIAKDNFIFASLDFDFYVIHDLNLEEAKNLDTAKLLKAANAVEFPGYEFENARIKISLLDGNPYEADYFANGVLYAHAVFSRADSTVVRTVDKDGDGVFELTEIYALDSENVMSAEDKILVSKNLFGFLTNPDSMIYLQSIRVDNNADTNPDFIEEYLPHGNRISSWDTNNDGKWDVRYEVIMSGENQSDKIENSYFYDNEKIVRVQSFSGVPSAVFVDNDEIPVFQGSANSFYWIGEKGLESEEQKIFEALKEVWVQGACIEIENNDDFIKAVRVGSTVFGKRIIKTDLTKESIENYDEKETDE